MCRNYSALFTAIYRFYSIFANHSAFSQDNARMAGASGQSRHGMSRQRAARIERRPIPPSVEQLKLK